MSWVPGNLPTTANHIHLRTQLPYLVVFETYELSRVPSLPKYLLLLHIILSTHDLRNFFLFLLLCLFCPTYPDIRLWVLWVLYKSQGYQPLTISIETKDVLEHLSVFLFRVVSP